MKVNVKISMAIIRKGVQKIKTRDPYSETIYEKFILFCKKF